MYTIKFLVLENGNYFKHFSANEFPPLETTSLSNASELLNNIQQMDSYYLIIIDEYYLEKIDVTILNKLIELKKNYYIHTILILKKFSEDMLLKKKEFYLDDYFLKTSHFILLKERIDLGIKILNLEQQNRSQQSKNQIQSKLLEDELSKTQKSFLPEHITIKNYSLDWFYKPYRKTGGDMLGLYFFNKNHIIFYILDVAGHEIEATFLSIFIAQKISSYVLNENRNNSNPHELLFKLMEKISSLFGKLLDETERFFSLFIGTMNVNNGHINYVRAGHPAPFIIEKNKNVYELDDLGNLPIGIFENQNYQIQKYQLKKGDRILLYTDGIIETLNDIDKPFGIDGIKRVLEESINKSLHIKNIITSSKEWGKEKQWKDDVTLLEISRNL